MKTIHSTCPPSLRPQPTLWFPEAEQFSCDDAFFLPERKVSAWGLGSVGRPHWELQRPRARGLGDLLCVRLDWSLCSPPWRMVSTGSVGEGRGSWALLCVFFLGNSGA